MEEGFEQINTSSQSQAFTIDPKISVKHQEEPLMMQ